MTKRLGVEASIVRESVRTFEDDAEKTALPQAAKNVAIPVVQFAHHPEVKTATSEKAKATKVSTPNETVQATVGEKTSPPFFVSASDSGETPVIRRLPKTAGSIPVAPVSAFVSRQASIEPPVAAIVPNPLPTPERVFLRVAPAVSSVEAVVPASPQKQSEETKPAASASPLADPIAGSSLVSEPELLELKTQDFGVAPLPSTAKEVANAVTREPELVASVPVAMPREAAPQSVFEGHVSAEPMPMLQPAPVAYANSWVQGEVMTQPQLQSPGLFSHPASPLCGQGKGDWPCSFCGMTYCCCQSPCWRVRGDMLLLNRSSADGFDQPLVNCNCAIPTIFEPESLGFDPNVGPQITVIRDSQCGGCDFEGSYYIIDWDAGLRLDGPVFALGTDLGTGFATTRYESRLQNAEINAFKDVTNWSQFVFGVRWLQLDEKASVFGSGDLVPMFDERVDVTNQLLGGQMGWRKTVWDRGGFVTGDITTKAGLFHNSIDRTQTVGTSPLEKNGLSFVGDLSFNLNCEITQCWSLNAGYQLLWVTGIAEAPDQFFSPDQIFDEGTLFAHGLRLGVTKTF